METWTACLPQLSLDTSLPLLSENSLLSVHTWWRPLGTEPPPPPPPPPPPGPPPTSTAVTDESPATAAIAAPAAAAGPLLWLTSATDDIFVNFPFLSSLFLTSLSTLPPPPLPSVRHQMRMQHRTHSLSRHVIMVAAALMQLVRVPLTRPCRANTNGGDTKEQHLVRSFVRSINGVREGGRESKSLTANL